MPVARRGCEDSSAAARKRVLGNRAMYIPGNSKPASGEASCGKLLAQLPDVSRVSFACLSGDFDRKGVDPKKSHETGTYPFVHPT